MLDFRPAAPPSREGSTSSLVRYAYFTRVFLKAGTIYDQDLPPAYTEFDPSRDAQVVFVAALNNPGKNFVVRVVLKRPDGTEHARSSKNTTVTVRHNWFYSSHEFATAGLKAYPGEWSLDLFVDDQQVGIYRFLLGDAATIAGLKPKRRLEDPVPPLPPGVNVEPPGPDVPPVLGRFSGRWEGIWVGVGGNKAGNLPHVVIFERVGRSGVSAIYSWGRSSEWSIEPGFSRVEGTVEGERTIGLRLSRGIEARYTLSGDGETLAGEYRTPSGGLRATVVLRKAAPRLEIATKEKREAAPLEKPALSGIVRTPPAIALLEPRLETPIEGEHVKLKLEVRSPFRLRVLTIVRTVSGRELPAQGFSPDPSAPVGEPWRVETVLELEEGDNPIRIEAVDEDGRASEQRVTLTRQSLIAVELRGPPGARVQVNRDGYTLDQNGVIALRLRPGFYQVEASKEGFHPWREVLTLSPGQSAVVHQIVLVPVAPPPPPVATPAPAPAPPPVATIPPAIAAPPPDIEAPRIAINYPPPETKVERDSIVVLGLVTDNVEVARVQVTVNGVEAALARDIAVAGKGVPIRAPAALQPGENVIEVTATDKAGNVAQEVRAVTRIIPAPPAPPPPRVANRWAVVIGVGEYDHPSIPKLRYAAQDAEAIYRFLVGEGGYAKEHVQLLTDSTPLKPTLLNIKRALGDFLYRRAGREDMVLIYFAGHGAPEVDAGGAESDGLSKYLVPRNADPESLYTTAFPMDEIQRIFARLQAERVVFLLDTCYSGTAGGRTFARQQIRAGGLNDQFLERLTRSRGRVIITASGPNEVALELPELGHGVFTYYVLEGLRGKGDRNGDGVVTVSELYEYVEEQVERKAREAGGRQRPVMKGEIEGSLPLSVKRSR